MDESTEELKANMEKAFAQRVEADQRLTALADHLNSGKGTYVTAEEYAYQTGKVLSGVFREQITEEKLPEGVFTKEFVQETIEPLLKDDHKIVSTMAAVAQENINTAAGVHIQPQKADYNQDRADGFATKMEGKTMEEAGWMLGSPVTNFSQSVVDETMIKNGEVLAKAGKAATIKRDAEGGCCDWCSSKAGTFDATNREAYQRHRECRCEIEMHLDGSVKRQTDWKKNQWEEVKKTIASWFRTSEKAEQEQRKQEIREKVGAWFNGKQTVENIGENGTIKPRRGQLDSGYVGKVPNNELEAFNKKALEQIKLDTGYSEEEARKFQNAAMEYFGGDYNKILTGKTETANIIADGLKRMPSYDGTIYRGICLEDDAIKDFTGLKAGDILPEKGRISSWSSNERVAVSFCGASDYERNSVIFECENNLTAPGVQHLSKFGTREAEVLSYAKYEVVEVTIESKYDYLSRNPQLLYFQDDLEEEERTLKREVVCRVKVRERQ